MLDPLNEAAEDEDLVLDLIQYAEMDEQGVYLHSLPNLQYEELSYYFGDIEQC